HRVYNLTVQGEHLYRVAHCGVLVHNNRCDVVSEISLANSGKKIDLNAAKGGAPAKRVSNQTVLGRYPDYVRLSDDLGARRFDIPSHIWKEMAPAEQWAANRKFLDRLVAKGDEIILSNPANSARPGSFFAREIEYLKSLGFRVSDDGLRILPPGT
ncbi:MAG TPA: hypothetical protein VMM76_08250, partial [Pirellulaceae bacterium]|nr:hypothetical protein [Pirellulaceae bacterium]